MDIADFHKNLDLLHLYAALPGARFAWEEELGARVDSPLHTITITVDGGSFGDVRYDNRGPTRAEYLGDHRMEHIHTLAHYLAAKHRLEMHLYEQGGLVWLSTEAAAGPFWETYDRLKNERGWGAKK